MQELTGILNQLIQLLVCLKSFLLMTILDGWLDIMVLFTILQTVVMIGYYSPAALMWIYSRCILLMLLSAGLLATTELFLVPPTVESLLLKMKRLEDYQQSFHS